MATSSFAQNINSLETRLDRMEREMQTLSRSVFKGDVPPPQLQVQGNNSQIAGMEMRLNQIEDQMRRLTGMIEENSFRLRKMENAGGSSSVTSTPMQPSIPSDTIGESSSFTVDNTPYQLGTITNNNGANSPASLYDQAFSYLQVNDYASAQGSFDDFLAQYPDHSLAENAKYWLAETYFARGDYQTASRSFARYFKDHPDGQKAPDTLLKLAMSLNGQNMTEEACLTLQELGNRFANAPQSILDKAEQERQAYSCQ